MKNNTKVNNNSTNNNSTKVNNNTKVNNIVSGKTYVRPLHSHNICTTSLSFCSCVKHKK